MITTYGATEGVDEASAPYQPPPGLSKDQLQALERLVLNREQLDPERRVIVEELAKKHKIAMPPASGVTEQPNQRKEQMSVLGEAAKVSALPMSGQIIGGTLGAPFGPAGVIAGQGIGGMAGLVGNQLLGISEPDAFDAALTGTTGLTARLLTHGARRAIPGVEAAEQQIGAELLRGVPPTLPGSQQATQAAYDRLAQLGSPNIPVPNLQRAVTSLFDTERIAKKYGGQNATIRRGVMEAARTLTAQNGEMPFQEASIMLKRYRQKIAGLESKGGEEWGAYKELRKSLFQDMEAAAQAGGQNAQLVQAQREAMAAAKAQIAKDELTEAIEKFGVKSITVSGQTFEVIEPTKILNKLKDLDFAGSVGPQQWKAIEKTLKQLAAIPKVNTATGTGVGTTMRAVAMAGSGVIGGAIGTPIVGGVAGAAGAAVAIKAYDAAASLMMSDRGRNFLVKLFKANNGRMSERTAQLLQFGATQLEDVPGQDQ